MSSAKDFMPSRLSINSLRAAAKKCEGCPLYKEATQTVFGQGSENARLIIVGEIPGDKEDEQGAPFVGPAGTLLRDTIQQANLDWEDVYLTNVVKHFKFYWKNNRRMHRSPVGTEIKACMPWLEAEITAVQPQAILCLGATAAKALVDKNFHISEGRGKWFDYSSYSRILVTYHPSAILRAPDIKVRYEMKKNFVSDVKKVAEFLVAA
jgi:uracil-DNA glycosylase